MFIRKAILALILALLAAFSASAAPLPAYKATAGLLPIGKDPERPDAELFHADYIAQDADPLTRPVTFVFNGGPGAASIYMHLAAIGPMTIATAGDGSFPVSPARLQPNPDSWLAFTDLVFIDPVGAGYSRMLAGADGKPRDSKPYESIAGDIDSIALFIRQWLTVNGRWGSPKAIAGESYGGLRVAALSRLLAEQYAINLNRAVLMSPALNVDLADRQYSLIAPMTLLPTQAAIAAFHGLTKLGDDPAAIQAVEDYATAGYVAGLVSLGHVSAEEEAAFYAKVGSLIGFDPAIVARHHGRVSEAVFVQSLLARRGLVIDTYDGTQTSDNPRPEEQSQAVLDRSLTILSGVLLAPFMDYVRNELGYVTTRPYIPLNLELNARFDRNTKLGAPDDLGVALAQNHDLKALVLHGYHDLNANYYLSRYVLEQATRGADARRRLSFRTYPGGHMFYLRGKSRAAMVEDVRKFYETAP